MQIRSRRLLHSIPGMIAGVLILLNLSGCEWGDRTISLIRPDTDDLQVVFTDTITTSLSTVMKDSIMTSGSSGSLLLAGKYNDPSFGTVEATAFALMQMESIFGLQERAVYDSLVFSTNYSYSYGDTNQVHRLRLHTLLDDITRGPFYNINNSTYETAPIGEQLFKATRESNNGALRIRLSDELGRKLFDAAAANKLKSQDELMGLFKGFALVSQNTNAAGFLGFARDSTFITLHYHVDGADGKTKYNSRLTTGSSYNRMVNDRTGTPFEGLVTSRVGLPASQTGNVSIIQSGVGVMTRLDIPYLHTFKFDLGKVIVNRAFLKIKLSNDDYNRYMPPPDEIGLYLTSKNNDWEASYSPLARGKFVDDHINNERYYRIDITSYIIQQVNQNQESYGFLLGPTTASGQSNAYINTLSRMKLSGRNAVELQIYYTNLNY